MKQRLGTLLLAAVLAGAATGCDDEGEMMMPEEPRAFSVTIENIASSYDFPTSGVFDTPLGATTPGPAFPGDVYQFDVVAPPGSRLSFATMFVQSNDWFYAPDGGGIELWDGSGAQISGDVTDQLMLFDSGTEEDEEPGLGANQAPRQGGPDTGPADDDTTVRLAEDTWGNIPATTDVIQVTVTPLDETTFRVRIENVSTATTLSSSDGSMHPVPLAPGAWVVHTTDDPLFTVGEADRGEGLAALAEDGDVASLGASVAGRTGVAGPIAPGVWAVHTSAGVLFTAGSVDAGLGMEALAEDGDPAALAASTAGVAGVASSGAFDTPVGAGAAAPAFPGESYSFEIMAVPGDRLSFATMFVQSNDLFYAPAEVGLDLFPGGSALSGDVTGMILLWDAGTEVNEQPGIGLHQAPRQAGPDTGVDESEPVAQVNDGYTYPATGDFIRVTVQPIG